MFVRASLYKRREENQLDGTAWFIALVICSTSPWPPILLPEDPS